MPEVNLTDLIEKIFKENQRSFLTLKQTIFFMSSKTKRELGILGLTNAAEMQKILAPFLDTKRYVFHRRGTFVFILEAKPHEDFVLEAVKKRTRTPKDISRLVPFSKKETAGLIGKLIEKNLIRLSLDDDLQTRIYYVPEGKREKQKETAAKNPKPEIKTSVRSEENKAKQAKPKIEAKPEYAEYTVENFRNAFHSLDNGRIFVRICDLRKILGWPRAIFDSALKQLRDAKLIQLHAGDVTLMTPEEVQDCFVDENGFRMGTITWHGR